MVKWQFILQGRVVLFIKFATRRVLFTFGIVVKEVLLEGSDFEKRE